MIYINILAIGDVVGTIGCNFLMEKLPGLKKFKNIDVTIVNGENSADGNGITPASAEKLFNAGADVITTGNHAFRRKEMFELYDSHPYILRPANYPCSTTPGKGICTLDMRSYRVNVINLMGTAFMESLDCPFRTMDALLDENPAEITIVDFHAESTGEKRAMGYYLDGKVSAVFGTHTHVQTSDETVLPNGCGYITDVGMTGPIESVLGIKPEIIIDKMRNKLPVRFEIAQGDCKLNGIIFNINEKNGKTISAKRIEIV